MTSPVKLYSYWRSSASWRVRIALQWKGIAYEYVAVSLVNDGGEHLKEQYGAVNPLHAVPTLEIDGHILSESIAIIEYLEETRPQLPLLLPKDPYLRAQARRIAEVFNAGTQPMQNLRLLKQLEAQFNASNEEKKKFVGHFLRQSLGRLEELLGMTAGEYCVGNTVTVADVYLVPQCYGARRFDVDPAQFPRLAAIERRLTQLPAFQAADPSRQPDTPRDR